MPDLFDPPTLLSVRREPYMLAEVIDIFSSTALS
jgi:hypothetical protein